MKIQTTIEQLETIIAAAKNARKNNSSMSSTIVLEQLREVDTHLGSDFIGAELKCNYAECNNQAIYYNF